MSTVGQSRPRHVIVSGGSRGLGKALVTALLKAGNDVSTFSRRPTDFIQAQEGNPLFYFAPADLGEPKSVEVFLLNAEAQFGPPFGLVNCAGIVADGVLASMSPELIRRVLDVNLAGTLQLTRLVVRRMLVNHSGGSIVNVSSIIGLRGYSGLAVYAATKGGIDAMTRALARELGSRKIRVNSIAPGYLETDMTHRLSTTQRKQIVGRTPLGRLGVPEDVTGPVLFLLSDDSAFITGQVLVADGGISA